MGIPFPDIDPYEVLGVDKSASPVEIKKTYKKLCLKYHPDKLQQSKSDEGNNQEIFTKIQFSFSILNDPIKRTRYDNTGSLAEFDGDDEGFDWKEYFESINEKITLEMIEEDRVKYQDSEEEKLDILNNFIYYEGDFLKLFELIPHLEFTELEEQRVYNIIDTELAKITVSDAIRKSWEKYTRSRKTKVKQMLKKLAKEAKQAEELSKMIKMKKDKDLTSLIKSRQANRLDDLISNLENKYGEKKGKKRSSKDIDDDEFERLQSEILKKKK
ncbi:DnaJ subfamily C member 9 [Candida viswanathii]|uniref:DnaJ subfamily C member 9 n=1 Tax=Candida viswanathii TaxID=5486 RepID=A0A367XQG8_9ASCO|nr:DnaJ subfamily C member 9 [Candida viswanathii]